MSRISDFIIFSIIVCTLIYVLGIIILIDGILVIEGIGIILCTLVRYYVT